MAATLPVLDRPVNYRLGCRAVPRTSTARDRIVHTAARLFVERSYHAVGVDELCAEADVRKGSFYHHFSSKAELAKAVLDLHAAAFESRLASAEDMTPAERLYAVADAIGAIQGDFEAQFGRVVGCPFGNLAAELATTDEEVRAHVSAKLADMERELAVVCRDAAERGVLRDGSDPDAVAHALLAQYQGMILLAKVNASGSAGLAPALRELIDNYLAEPVGA
jgi:TetR/AcrR family transcriptional regulator, transcriptional repressor for nem operon